MFSSSHSEIAAKLETLPGIILAKDLLEPSLLAQIGVDPEAELDLKSPQTVPMLAQLYKMLSALPISSNVLVSLGAWVTLLSVITGADAQDAKNLWLLTSFDVQIEDVSENWPIPGYKYFLVANSTAKPYLDREQYPLESDAIDPKGLSRDELQFSVAAVGITITDEMWEMYQAWSKGELEIPGFNLDDEGFIKIILFDHYCKSLVPTAEIGFFGVDASLFGSKGNIRGIVPFFLACAVEPSGAVPGNVLPGTFLQLPFVDRGASREVQLMLQLEAGSLKPSLEKSEIVIPLQKLYPGTDDHALTQVKDSALIEARSIHDLEIDTLAELFKSLGHECNVVDNLKKMINVEVGGISYTLCMVDRYQKAVQGTIDHETELFRMDLESANGIPERAGLDRYSMAEIRCTAPGEAGLWLWSTNDAGEKECVPVFTVTQTASWMFEGINMQEIKEEKDAKQLENEAKQREIEAARIAKANREAFEFALKGALLIMGGVGLSLARKRIQKQIQRVRNRAKQWREREPKLTEPTRKSVEFSLGQINSGLSEFAAFDIFLAVEGDRSITANDILLGIQSVSNAMNASKLRRLEELASRLRAELDAFPESLAWAKETAEVLFRCVFLIKQASENMNAAGGLFRQAIQSQLEAERSKFSTGDTTAATRYAELMALRNTSEGQKIPAAFLGQPLELRVKTTPERPVSHLILNLGQDTVTVEYTSRGSLKKALGEYLPQHQILYIEEVFRQGFNPMSVLERLRTRGEFAIYREFESQLVVAVFPQAQEGSKEQCIALSFTDELPTFIFGEVDAGTFGNLKASEA